MQASVSGRTAAMAKSKTSVGSSGGRADIEAPARKEPATEARSGMRAWQAGRRRGRPRQPREVIDHGTPESQARRALLAAGEDPRLTEYPLGLMLARGLIGSEQHEAGCFYAFLYGRTVGRTQVSCAARYREMVGGGAAAPLLEESSQARLQQLFRTGKNRLLAASRRVCDATENLVVYARIPRFLERDRGRPWRARQADAIALAAVIDGLDTLVACYGKAAGRRGRMEAHRAPSFRQGMAPSDEAEGSGAEMHKAVDNTR